MTKIRMADQHGAPISFDLLRDGVRDTGRGVSRGRRTRFTIRASVSHYCVGHLVIADPELWRVCDIRVHGHSQLASQHGSGPRVEDDGVMADALDPNVVRDAVQTAMNFTIDVVYLGGEPYGGDFECVMRCTVA
jgi:hypothetical protein